MGKNPSRKENKITPPQNRKNEGNPATHPVILIIFGCFAAFFTIAFIFWTFIPYLQMTTYMDKITSGKAHQVLKTDFIFSPYTYSQRVIRYEFLKYLEEQNIGAQNIPLFDGAIEKMEELVEREGSNPYQHIRLGRAYDKKVELLKDNSYFKKADESYKKAIALAPQRQETYYAYALSLVRQSRADEAIKILEVPPALDKDIPISYFYLGLAQFNFGETTYVDALTNLETSFALSNVNPDMKVSISIYQKLLAYFYRQPDRTRLFTCAVRLASFDSDQKSLYQGLADLMKTNDRFPSLMFNGGKLSQFS
jgi:tetratricopeptide (TPR) repeat protein